MTAPVERQVAIVTGRPAPFFATMDNVTGQAVNVDGGFTFH